jgi:thiamine biosynthesis lipoprotein
MNASRFGRRRFLKIVGVQTAALAAGVSRGASSPEADAQLVAWHGIAMGTEVSIQLFSEDPVAARKVLTECREEIVRLENIFSLYDARSSVSRLNSTGVLNDAPPELLALFGLTRRFSELTNGAFDVSIHPLCELLADSTSPVEEGQIARALELVDYRQIVCTGETVRFAQPGMRVTFNGVAQGFVTDAVAGLLRNRGFDKTLVDLGEKRALGPRADGRAWRIGVESPRNQNEIAGVLELDGRAMATSGGYGQVFQSHARHHLLNARNGRSHHEFETVSVLAPTAAVADALSTCLAVLDPDTASSLLRHFPETEAFAIRAGQSRLSRIT